MRRFSQMTQACADNRPRRYPREALQRIKNKLKLYLLLAAGGWLVCGVAFIPISISFGGTAKNGKIEAGHYYVGEHGVYKEVSRNAYIFSAISTGLFGLTAALTGLVGLLFSTRSRWPQPLIFQIGVTILGVFVCALVGYVSMHGGVRCIVMALQK